MLHSLTCDLFVLFVQQLTGSQLTYMNLSASCLIESYVCIYGICMYVCLHVYL